MKTIKDIDLGLNDLASAMSEKGIDRPNPNVVTDFGGRVSLWLHADSLIGGEECHQYCGNTHLTVFEQAMLYIKSLPSAEEKNNHDFLKALSRVAEMGRDLQIDDEFVAPLFAAKKALSSNLLAAPS